MDLEHLRTLLAVAEHGSITDAAQVLGVSQPALSRRIQQLEEDLGARLLERSQRGAVLTEIGRLARTECARMLERYERLQRDVRAHVALDVGSVRVGGGATAVSFVLPDAIAGFRREHPGVRFQLREAGSLEVAQDVLDERLDLGIVTLPVALPELSVRPLRDDRIVLVGAREHPLAGKRGVATQALSGQAVVGFEAGSAIRKLIDGALRDAGVAMDVVMELRSVAAIVRMAATTGSLAFVSELGVPPRDRRIAPIGVRGLRIVRKLGVVHKRERPLSPAAEAFATALLRGGTA